MRCRAAWFIVSLLSLLLASSAVSEQPSTLWLDVPFVRQEKDGCGSASIAMVMQYWEQRAGLQAVSSAAEIQRQLYSPKARGIYASDMERYFTNHGYHAFAFAGTWDDLSQQIAKGRPVIVALETVPGDLHYVVIAGLDFAQHTVLKNDPAERKLLKQSRASFEKEWKAAAHWMLLAVPRERSSASP
jgi:predicted double-glycine peptidase